MNLQFELNTTVREPLYITVNISKITLQQFRCKLFDEIKKNTTLTEEDILDFFVNDLSSTNTLTIPNTRQLVKDFIPMNRTYFPHEFGTKDTYKLYAIDRMYREEIVGQRPSYLEKIRKNRIDKQNKLEIKTNHMDDILKFTRKFIPF